MFVHLLPDSDPPPGNRSLQYSQPQLLMQVFEGVISRPGQTSSSRLELTSAEKKKRVVLKRVNLDKSGIRSNFLATGTQARVRGCLHLPPAGGALPPSRAGQGLLFKGQRNPALCLCLCAAEEVDDPFQKSTNHASMTAANKVPTTRWSSSDDRWISFQRSETGLHTGFACFGHQVLSPWM